MNPLSNQALCRLAGITLLLFPALNTGAARADAFVETGDMKEARWIFSATLLPDGRILVAGGGNGSVDGVLGSAELYDPATGKWTETGAMKHPRAFHAGTLLSSGQVLVTGGFNPFVDSPNINSAELYDPATGQWTETGSLLQPRVEPVVTLLPNGKVLMPGGVINLDTGETTAAAELYDPATGLWTATGPLLTNLNASVITTLANGKVLFAGGRTRVGGTNLVNTAELYDPSTGSWSATGSMSTARNGHVATLLQNGQVLVAGGVGDDALPTARAEIYNPESATWTNTTPMNVARVAPTANLLANGKVLIIGGFDSVTGEVFSTAELYDPATGTWQMAASMTEMRYDHRAVTLPNGQILVIGGDNNVVVFPSAELYVPDDATASSLHLTSPQMLPGGTFQFNFTATPAGQFTVLATTNASTPLLQWTQLPGLIEVTPGNFRAVDTNAWISSRRFYVVRKP